MKNLESFQIETSNLYSFKTKKKIFFEIKSLIVIKMFLFIQINKVIKKNFQINVFQTNKLITVL